ncbi:DUF4376 domain-containing protein [Laribacter hongkongensis]|uniref:DUF4376 domain-containing protein n=1 Tax=Laribacter hongkongensis TaxID=168471 RepID=UPI001EFE25B4|nr:DUF4376 domain-containing protein [Laribacter hongkongensis]MCG9080362.1 DUF4376 domain-containing protein [Laribacter hongkongensis]
MLYAFFGDDGRIVSAHNDATVAMLPAGAIELTEEQWKHRFDMRLADGELINDPLQADIGRLRTAAIARLPAWEKSERAAGIEHAGQRWLTTSAALQDIRDVLLAGAVPNEQWVTADRQIVAMTLPELQSLWQAITARGAAIYQRRLEIEQQVADMSREQLEAFQPGWPEPAQA